MELETINKLYLELSQFATAKTARELKLESESIDEDKINVLYAVMHEREKGWGKISSKLKHDSERGLHSFDVRFEDGTKNRITFRVQEMLSVEEI